MKGIDIAGKLKGLNMTIDDPFLVHMLLNSLPDHEYSHLKSLYNTQKEKWSLNELISICVQEEDEMIRKGKAVSINYVSEPKIKKNFGNKNYKPSSSKSTAMKSDQSKNKSLKTKRPMKCFFCKKTCHFKKDCEGFKNWLNKKGTFLLKSVSHLESHALVDDKTWWFDTDSPIHIVNSLQRLSSKTIPNKNETRVCTASGQRVAVQAVGSVKLVFENKFVLVLDKVYCIPSTKRNLIYGSQFVMNNGFSFSI